MPRMIPPKSQNRNKPMPVTSMPKPIIANTGWPSSFFLFPLEAMMRKEPTKIAGIPYGIPAIDHLCQHAAFFAVTGRSGCSMKQ
eukprot:763560-Hanusia_phi.AAC.3